MTTTQELRNDVRNMVAGLKMAAIMYQDDQTFKQLEVLSDEPTAIELFRVLDDLMNRDDYSDFMSELATFIHATVSMQMDVEGITYEDLTNQVDWRELVRVYNTVTVGDKTYEVLRSPFKSSGENDHSYMLVQLTGKGLLELNVPINLRIVRRPVNQPEEVLDEQNMVISRFGYGLMKEDTGHCTEICNLLAILNDPEVAFINKIVIGDKVFNFNKGDIYSAFYSEIVEAMKKNVGGVFEFHSADFAEDYVDGVQRHTIVQVPIELAPSNTVH